MSTHLESASALHCGATATASLFDQSRGFMSACIAKANQLGASCLAPQMIGPWRAERGADSRSGSGQDLAAPTNLAG